VLSQFGDVVLRDVCHLPVAATEVVTPLPT
jgi:hypothetical protein